jgi:hypothetical protein
MREGMKICSKLDFLAALNDNLYSFVAYTSSVNTNNYGTLNMVKTARYFAVIRLLHTSTSEIYQTV